MSTQPEGGALKVALVVTSDQTARLFVLGFAMFLRDQGAHVTVVCDGGDRFNFEASAEGLQSITVPMRRDPSPVHDLEALLGLFRVLRRIRPDVVVYATPKASLLSAVAGRLTGIPVRLYDLWGLRLETVRGPFAQFLRVIERVTMLASTAVVANSPSLARRARELGLSQGRSVVVLGGGSSHGVDTGRYRPGAVNPDKLDPGTREFLRQRGGVVLGFVGRMHPDKGVDTLLEAANICVSRGIDVRVMLIGEDEGFDPRKRCPILFNEGRAHLVDRVDDLTEYYRAIDILSLPSRREGFPNVVLEAAATGIPSIVSDATGVVDSVVHEETGLVTPLDDAGALAAAIERLALDGDLRARLGEFARQRVERDFAQRHVWQRRSDFIHGLVAPAGPIPSRRQLSRSPGSRAT